MKTAPLYGYRTAKGFNGMMAGSLGKKMMSASELVEWLKKSGCAHFQGFTFSIVDNGDHVHLWMYGDTEHDPRNKGQLADPVDVVLQINVPMTELNEASLRQFGRHLYKLRMNDFYDVTNFDFVTHE